MYSLNRRHRDVNGEISRQHGETLVCTLREIYGPRFALGSPAHIKLCDVLKTLDEPSWTDLNRDHNAAHLSGKIASIASATGPFRPGLGFSF